MAASALVALGLTACSHQITPTVAPAQNIYRAYDEHLPGKYALFIQTGTWSADVSVSSWTCGAHRFAFDANRAFHDAVLNTVSQIVEKADVVTSAVPQSELAGHGYVAQIAVHSAAFRPQVAFSSDMFSGTAHAKVNATIHAVVLGPDGVVMQTSIEGDGSGEKSSLSCGAGGDALDDAISSASREIMERLGEHLMNAPQLRTLAGTSVRDAQEARAVIEEPMP